MCGICGIIDYNENSKVDRVAIGRMCAEMERRGPDDEGIYINKSRPAAGLGHRRLSIIDLSAAGHQPMSNEDGSLWIVFNGEVYNYKELRADLEKKGHIFKSNSDTETVIHLYEVYGEECVKHLRGMFAFAIWDERKHELLLARDRVGKKPLLYHHADNRFCFASEFSSILAGGLIDKEINKQAIEYYLTLGYIPAPFTIYKDVFKLPPAHTLVLKDGKAVASRYWELDFSRKLEISEEEAEKETLRLLGEAVRIRLYSEVPLGAFLSGGIDSSVVVALMSRLSGNKVKTFSIGFEEEDYSELEYARIVARRFGTDHHEFIVRPKALEVLPLLVERYGEPYADSSCIPSYYVSQQTKQFVTVALNGDGGDESFAGYERYQAMMIAEYYRGMPALARAAVGSLADLLPDSIEPKNSLRRIRRFFDNAALPKEKRYLRWVGIFGEVASAELYTDDFYRTITPHAPLDLIGSLLKDRGESSLLDRLLMTDIETNLPGDLLVKMDVASMANSLETRSPFLDQKLMEFAARLPDKYKIRRMTKKYILKKAAKDLIPRQNIYRRKMGFGVPVGKWFRGDMKGFLAETLLSDASLKRGYFNPAKIRELVEKHVSGQKDYSFQLWALLMLELWHRRFIDH